MSDQEHLFLSVGTEVSAKFKGAFCEAKIKNVNKCVKCKVSLKSTNEQLVIDDDNIKGILKVGQLVEIRKTENDDYQSALITKIQDLSTYTVVFNDGDEKTLKRSFLRFKGERHFLECETLNNSPLTHPEHFSNPVKNQNNTLSSSSSPISINSNSNITCQERISNRLLSNNESENSFDENNIHDLKIGSVVIVEKNNEWYPALITKIKHKKKFFTVRNFKDGKLNIVKNSEISDYNYSKISKNDQEDMKDTLDIVKNYIEKGTLPNFHNDSSHSDDEYESTSSDEEQSEEKDRFVAQLYKFMDDRDTPMNNIPSIGNVDLDLYKLFMIVKKMGGYNKVTKQKNWNAVYKKLCLPLNMSSNVLNLKSAYKCYLHPYEEFYRKLGSSICDSHNSIRASDSHRRLQLFKHRSSTSTTEIKKQSKIKDIKKDDKNNEIFRQNTSNELIDKSESEIEDDKIAINDSNIQKCSKQPDFDNDSKINCFDNKLSNSSSNDNSCDSLENISANQNENLTNACGQNNFDDETEGVTLTSMVKNLNEVLKKRKKQEKKERKIDQKIEKKKKNDSKENESIIKNNKKKPDLNKMKLSKEGKMNKYSLAKSSSSSSVSSRINTFERRKLYSSWSKRRNLCLKKKFNTRKDNIEKKIENKNENTEDGNSSDSKVIKSKYSRKSSFLTKDSKQINNSFQNKNEDIHIKSNNKIIDVDYNDVIEEKLINDINSEINMSNDQNDYIKLTARSSFNISINDLDKNKIIDVKYGDIKCYRAKIVKIDNDTQKVLVHYAGWNNRYDEWISLDRILKIHDDNTCMRKRKTSIKKTRLSEKYENEIEITTNDDAVKIDDLINSNEIKIEEITKTASNSVYTSTTSCTATCNTNTINNNDNHITLVSIKDEVIDNEYDNKVNIDNYDIISKYEADNLNKNENKKVSTTEMNRSSTTEEAIIKKNEDLSNDININNSATNNSIYTRKNRLLSEPNCDQINNKRKSDNNSDSTNECSNISNKQINQKYEIFKPTIKISRKELISNIHSKNINLTNSMTINTNSSLSPNNTENDSSIENGLLNDELEKINNNILKNEFEGLNEKKIENNSIEENGSKNNGLEGTEKITNINEINVKNFVNDDYNLEIVKQNQDSIPCLNSQSLDFNCKRIATENVIDEKSNFPENRIGLSSKDIEIDNLNFNNIKYNFHIIEKNLIGEEKIKTIEDHMRECRKIYLKLKNEIIIIDKKRKKHRRKLLNKQSNQLSKSETTNIQPQNV